MIDVIRSIFQENLYVVREFDLSDENFRAFVSSSEEGSGKEEYFFVLEHNDLSDIVLLQLLEEKAALFLNEMEQLIKEKSLKKNVTMILLAESGLIKDKNNILHFEEDPYSFKKNVLTYAKPEVQFFNEVINKDYSLDNINNLIMFDGGNAFENFKNQSFDGYPFYPLLMRLVTKLPVIHYISLDNDLADLEEQVRLDLDNKENRLLEYLLTSPIPTEDEEIEKYLLSEWEGD